MSAFQVSLTCYKPAGDTLSCLPNKSLSLRHGHTRYARVEEHFKPESILGLICHLRYRPSNHRRPENDLSKGGHGQPTRVSLREARLQLKVHQDQKLPATPKRVPPARVTFAIEVTFAARVTIAAENTFTALWLLVLGTASTRP